MENIIIGKQTEYTSFDFVNRKEYGNMLLQSPDCYIFMDTTFDIFMSISREHVESSVIEEMNKEMLSSNDIHKYLLKLAFTNMNEKQLDKVLQHYKDVCVDEGIMKGMNKIKESIIDMCKYI